MGNPCCGTSLLPACWSHPADIAASVGFVADQAVTPKSTKCADFTMAYVFKPIVVENLGPINASALEFISSMTFSGDSRQAQFLFNFYSL